MRLLSASLAVGLMRFTGRSAAKGWRRIARRYSWWLNEAASASRENLDVEHVSRYDAKEDAGPVEELTMLKELGLNSQSEIVDIGAGTGQFTLAAASACARVVAVDVSPVMLAALEAKVSASGLSNVEVVQSGFLTYKHLRKAS